LLTCYASHTKHLTGSLPQPARLANGYRSYEPVHLERLSFVRHCRALDIPLADIKSLLGALDAPQEACGDVNHLIDGQLGKLRARLKSMKALEKQLLQLRSACNGEHPHQRCGILNELVAAAHGEACVCHQEKPAQGDSSS
jgi:DNA-binding transcriptional MerR regulator